MMHEVVIEVYEGIAIGMRCATCKERITVRPERAAISLTDAIELNNQHVRSKS